VKKPLAICYGSAACHRHEILIERIEIEDAAPALDALLPIQNRQRRLLLERSHGVQLHGSVSQAWRAGAG
jgi:hypothetical protein